MLKLLEGKKTYIGAAIIAISGLAGYHYGAIPIEGATAMLGAACATAGLGNKCDRYFAKALEIAAKK